MSVGMSGNWINVRPGEPAFNLMSNMCDYFEIGNEAGDDVWLEGQVLDGEFLFNGRLVLHDGSSGTVIDNFPRGERLDGWSQRRRVDVEGYELVDPRGEVIFSYRVEDHVCMVDVSLYQRNGELAATAGQDGIVSHVPTKLGRNGIVIG